MTAFWNRWFRPPDRPAHAAVQPKLFRDGEDAAGPVSLSHDVEVSAAEFLDVDSVRGLLDRETTSEFGRALVRQLDASLDHEGLRLPPLPDSVLRIQAALEAPDSSAREIAAIAETEPALATKLVGIANSPFYGGLESVVSVSDAIVRLGLRETRHIVFAVALHGRVLRVRVPGFEHAPAEIWRHQLAAAAAAQELAADAGLDPDTAFLGGLIHDLGRAVVLVAASEALRGLSRDEGDTHDVVVAEMDRLHAPLGALVVRAWKLPAELAAAVGAHHAPETAAEEARPLAALLRCADAVAKILVEDGSELTDEIIESAAMFDLDAKACHEALERAAERFAGLMSAL